MIYITGGIVLMESVYEKLKARLSQLQEEFIISLSDIETIKKDIAKSKKLGFLSKLQTQELMKQIQAL